MADETALIVEAGTQRVLSARLHQFSGIHIKKGGRVIIAPRRSRWSIWWVAGDVLIEGTVSGLEFARSLTTVTDKTPDGKLISHQFQNAAESGSGGAGGVAVNPGQGTSQGGSEGFGSAMTDKQSLNLGNLAKRTP